MSSPERIEDAALLTGRARFLDDLGEPPGCLQLAMLRSPHAHASIDHIDFEAALALRGVEAVITGADLAKLTTPLLVGVRLPMDCWPLAHERVRYVGEPVVVVAARTRYIAEAFISKARSKPTKNSFKSYRPNWAASSARQVAML